MGYKPVKKIYTITFEDYPGLEIKAVSASLGKLFELSNMRIEMLQKDPAKRTLVFETFAKRLIEWNVLHPEIEDAVVVIGTAADMQRAAEALENGVCPRCGLKEDDPIPLTGDAFLCLDLDFVMKLIMGWMEATSRVALPKELNSNDGEISTQEEPMSRLAAMQSPLTSAMLS